MKILNTIKFITVLAVVSVLLPGCPSPEEKTTENKKPDSTATPTKTLSANAVPNAMPYTLSFVEQPFVGLPCLQSYNIATSSGGYWFICGGRRQGLHTFKQPPANNFVKDSANHFMYVIGPTDGTYISFDVNQLSPNLSAFFQCTNQQSYFDRSTGLFYIVGGYGWKPDGSNMMTFPMMVRFNLDAMVSAIQNGATPAQITQLIEVGNDDRFAVTGGELFNLNGNFYLVFGQRFDGQYAAFGGSSFKQKYTEEVRVFTLLPNSLKINSYGSTTNTESDHPFHRRDGNIIDDVDLNGNPQITAFGGVFQPGIIGAYTYPVYINSPAAPVLQRNANQKFSQYECPVITVFDSINTKSVYHTFFGGISHYYYTQTPSQKHAYDTVTVEGRNDGFPFIEDITTFVQGQYGAYTEWIHTDPVPGNRLLGASIPFIIDPVMYSQNMAYDNGVLKLWKFPAGQSVPIGYIYGGIEAQNPLPLQPNSGTFVSNTVFKVYLNYTPSAAIPASEGHESTKSDFNLQRK